MDFQSALRHINQEIGQLPLNRQPVELYEPVAYFMSLGGKRMRPLLSLLGCYLFNDNYDKAVKPSVAIELFHNFTLIHDDIMDNAPLRRGMQTVHEKWNPNIALLSGDITMILAYEMLAHTPDQIRAGIFERFNLTARQVCEGQQFDMNFENREDVSIGEYIEMISLKTAVLLGFSLYMGARIGGSGEANAQKLYNAALLMGISFQIKDDLLDVFGEAAKVGKRVGGDIVSNKKTYLLLKAFEKADDKQKAALKQLLHDKCVAADDKVSAVIALYNELNIKEMTQNAIEEYFQKGINELITIDADENKKTFVREYFTQLMNREN